MNVILNDDNDDDYSRHPLQRNYTDSVTLQFPGEEEKKSRQKKKINERIFCIAGKSQYNIVVVCVQYIQSAYYTFRNNKKGISMTVNILLV